MSALATLAFKAVRGVEPGWAEDLVWVIAAVDSALLARRAAKRPA